MRDLIVASVIVGLMPACFRRPFIGLAVFSWLAYMRVQDLAWGFSRYQRWSFYVALITFAGFFVSKERKRFFMPDVRCYMLIAMVVLIGIGVALSEGEHTNQFTRYLEFVKIVAITLFTTAVVTNKERLRVMIWIIALSLGFYGVKSGIWGILSGGRSRIIQGPGGMLADNNDFSLALSMAVPMLFHLGWTERREILRKAFFFAMPLTVMTVGLTQSRGGFLSVSTAIGILVWRSRNRVAGIVVALTLMVAGIAVAPQSYRNRLITIVEHQQEGSAQGRLRAWGIASRMAMDNPVFGVGFNKFRQHYLEYCPDPTPVELSGQAIIVAHSSYFQIWAECGTPALAIYISLIGISFFTCWRVRRMARRRYHSSWIINYATMFEASLATFMVGSTFLNRAHFDLFYHWVALILVFGRIATEEMANEVLYPVHTGGRAQVRAQRHTGFEPRRRVGGFDRRPVPGSA